MFLSNGLMRRLSKLIHVKFLEWICSHGKHQYVLVDILSFSQPYNWSHQCYPTSLLHQMTAESKKSGISGLGEVRIPRTPTVIFGIPYVIIWRHQRDISVPTGPRPLSEIHFPHFWSCKLHGSRDNRHPVIIQVCMIFNQEMSNKVLANPEAPEG
jgi:hypothetical protein